MRIRPAAVLALLPPILGVVLGATLGAAEQPIVLDRPEQVGGLSTISASCRSLQHRSMQVDERPPLPQVVDFTVSLAAEREVLAVSAQGQPTRLRLTVASLTRTTVGKPVVVMLPAGAQLVAEHRGGYAVFHDNDAKELQEPVQQALRLVLDLGDGTPLQDQALGSAKPRSPGEQWAISPVPASRWLADLRLLVDPAKLSGSTVFSDLVPGTGPSSGGEQLHLTATLAFSGFTVPALSPGLTVTSSAGTLALDRLYPHDPALPMTAEKRLLKESLAAQGKSQQNGVEHGLAITIELEQSNDFRLTAHGPAPH
jgi:hypothetical protein